MKLSAGAWLIFAGFWLLSSRAWQAKAEDEMDSLRLRKLTIVDENGTERVIIGGQ